MKSSVLIGLIGGALTGSLLFYSLIHADESGVKTAFDIILYYSPQILYFMCLYMSVKIYTRSQDDAVPSFKGCLKAGGITAVIISIMMGIAFFVWETHIDIAAHVKEMYAHGQTKKDVLEFLSEATRQTMFDRAQFWSIPNFLLGFVLTVLVTVIFRLRGKKAA